MPLGGGIAGERDAVAMQSDLDPPDLVRRQIVLAPHRNQRVKRGVGIAAARIGFYADLHRLVDLAETGDGLVGMSIVAIANEKAVLAFDRLDRTDEIIARQGRSDHTVHRGSSDLVAFVPGAV